MDRWKKQVLEWADNNHRPLIKANKLIEMLKKDSDHPGLKEVVIQQVVENTEFDKRKPDVIENILKIIEDFYG